MAVNTPAANSTQPMAPQTVCQSSFIPSNAYLIPPKAAKNPKLREDLFTTAEYADFELSFEWRISPGGNSGLKYRVQDRFYCDDRQVKRRHAYGRQSCRQL